MRSRFDEQLALLNKELIEMGALCEEVIKLASEALTERSAALAAKVAAASAAARGEGSETDIRSAENDNRYGAHRRSG